jgi:hypothetical protein
MFDVSKLIVNKTGEMMSNENVDTNKVKTNEKKVYVITVTEIVVEEGMTYGNIVMDEKLHPRILDEILADSSPQLHTRWDWEEHTQVDYEEEYEYENDIPLPPINSVVLSWNSEGMEVDDHFTKKLKNYLDSTTPQQRKELGLVFENINKQLKPFRE